eukprot:COSAG02_NODE_593_length_19851_cov_13.232736_12_plen_379_part_00
MTDHQIAGLQKVLAKASRSTLLLLDNQTPWSLRLANSHCDSGSFPGNAKPVPRIRPNELVMCGCISAWVGDAEGNLRYDVEESSDSAAGPDDQVLVKWKNPMVDDLLSDRGKWTHVVVRGNQLDVCWALPDGTLHCKSAGAPEQHPRPTQEPNNRLKVTITMRGQTSAPWKATAAEQTPAENARENPRWIGSAESDACMLCQRAFGRVMDVKHHCRRCGWAVCDRCSPNKLVLNRWLEDDKPHALRETRSPHALRVCLGCYGAELAAQATTEPEPEPEPEAARGSGAMAAAAVAPSPWISVGAQDAGIKGEKLGPEYKTEDEVRQAFKSGSHLGYYQANGALFWALAPLLVLNLCARACCSARQECRPFVLTTCVRAT